MMRRCWFLLLAAILLVVDGQETLKPSKLQYSSSSSNFAGLSTDFLYTELQFDEELEVSENLFCSTQNYKNLPSYTTATCNPCNYSGPAGADGLCIETNLNVELEGRDLPDCVCDPTFCEGEILYADDEPKRYTLREKDIRLLFRYEAPDMETGFAVRLTAIDEGPVEVFVSNQNNLNAENILGEIHSTEPSFDFIKVCPSFNKYGEGSESVTYFIYVIVGDFFGKEVATFLLNVETLPNLRSDEEGTYTTPNFWPGKAIGDTEFSESPLYVQGTDLIRNVGYIPAYFIIGMAIPLTECTTFSYSVEVLHLNTARDNYYSTISAYLEIATHDTLETLTNPLELQPFKREAAVSDFYTTGAISSISHNGKVFSVCPTGAGSSDNPEYILARISSDPTFMDYSLLIFLREVNRDTRTRTNKIISDFFSPLHYQRSLTSRPILRCPCNDPCDDCVNRDVATIRFFNRFSAMSPETYPELIEKSNPPCDLAADIGIPLGDSFFYRCLVHWRDTTCGVLRTIPVFNYGNPRVYPMVDPVRLDNPFTFETAPDYLFKHDPTNPMKGNAMGVLFTVSVGDYTFLSEDRLLNECELGFSPLSNLHSLSDAPLDTEFRALSDFQKNSVTCNENNFNNVSKLLDQAQQELSVLARTGVLVEDSVRLGESLSADELVESSASATYASYGLQFSGEFQSCQALGDSFLDFQIIDKVLTDSTVCTTFDGEDPCCNETLAWETCCDGQGRDVVLENVSEPVSPNEDHIEDECADSECIETYVQDYRTSYEEVNLNEVCENKLLIDTGLNRVVSQCRKLWIGEDEFGKLCYSDDTCTEQYGTGQCDTVVNRCTGVRIEMELGFLGCLLEDVDSVTRSAITNELERAGIFSSNKVGKKATAELLRTYLVQDHECASDYGPMAEYRSRFEARSLTTPESQLCPVCYDIYCLSPFGCDWPLQCYDKRKNCEPELVPFETSLCTEPSGDDWVCNWDNSLSEEDCEIDTPVCMHCHNSSNCVILPATSQDECENTPICLLPEGEVLWDVSESDCEDIQYCTEQCNGGECDDQEECESVSGFCEDPDSILESVEYAIAQYPDTLANASNGVCITPLSPENFPSCPFLSDVLEFNGFTVTLDSRTGNSFDFGTHRGCVNFTRCSPQRIQFGAGSGAAILPRQCLHEHPSEQECKDNVQGTWLPLPIQNEQDCENPLRVDDDDFPGYCLEDRTGDSPYLSRKGRQDCEECGGIPRPPAFWRKGNWVGGLPRRAEWRNPSMTGKFLYVSDSISFLALNDLLSLSSSNVDAFLGDVGVTCSIFPFVNYFNLFACGCGGADSVDECVAPFQATDGAGSVIGSAWFCPGVSSTVGVSVGTLEINGSDVSGDLCKYATIAFANVEVFVGNRKQVPPTVLGDPNPIDDEAVRNGKGASVGEVVGDGFQFLISRSSFVNFREEIDRVKVTLFLDVAVLRRVPSNYVFDLGVEVLDKDDKRYPDEVELRPADAKIASGGVVEKGMTVGELLDEIDDNDFAVEFAVYWDKPFENGTPRLYPITREEDYKDENEDDVLSQGEKIMVAVFGALYGLSFVIAIFLTFLIFSKAPSLTNLILCILVYLVFIFRCVYLSMYAAGYFREEDAASFVLVEPPSFFLISIASVILMSYGFCLYCLKTHVQQDQAFSRFWLAWLICNIFLYLILVIVLVLETQLDTSDELVVDCFGRIVSVDESFTIQAIRIAYHSFLLIIAVVTCVSLFILGKKLDQTAATSSLSTLSGIAGVNVFLSSLLWVIYSAASGSSPYFVIPLFFCEALPLLAMMFKVIPEDA